MISGIINVDKPLGWTSHDVVGLVRNLTGQRQVGHAGTLDPLATGVLLVTVGAATRLSDSLMPGRKCYHARLRLGIRTSTDDAEGEIVAIRPTGRITREQIGAILPAFLGTIQQVPPAYAAIKRDGVPAYKLARRGQAPDLKPRTVRVDAVALTDLRDELCDLLVWCGAGTYIRALARDMGEHLGCGAHLAALRRLSSGNFTVETALGVQQLRLLAADGRLETGVQPMDEAVADWPAVVVDEQTAGRVLYGMPVPAGDLPAGTAEEARLYAAGGRLLALARYDTARQVWQPVKVMVQPEEKKRT